MKENKLSFESEDLIVDYISLNITDLRDPKPIAYYLNSFGFNSFLKKGEKGRSEALIFKKKDSYTAIFVQCSYDPESKSYWSGLIVRFAGKNANFFYQLIRRQQIDWHILNLSSTNLGRFDIHYLRDFSESETKEQLKSFFEKSCQKVKSTSPKRYAEFFRRKKGLILEIGNRSSGNRLRIYEKRNFLEFELEIKKGVIQSYQNLLFSDDITNFENKIIKHYYYQLKKSLALGSSYTEWLVFKLRKTFPKESHPNSLVNSYLEKSSFEFFIQKERFFRFLQFLSFLRNLKASKKQYIYDNAFYLVKFRVKEFLEFLKIPKKNNYQRAKIVEFLISLKKDRNLIQKFSDNKLRSYDLFTYIEIEKQERELVVRLLLGEEIYDYNYPFFFPEPFLTYKTRYELEVRVQFLQCISINNLEKKFVIEDFFKRFNISSKDKKRIRLLIIELFTILEKNKFIEEECKFTYKNGSSQTIKIKDMDPRIFTKSKYIYFTEKFNCNL